MRSRVRIVAEARDGGRTALTVLHGEGQLAVRPTGPGAVHLVGAAAGPLGGDEVDVDVFIGAGARLEIRGVAATLALPAASGDEGRTRFEARIEDGGELDVALQPLVVCRGARLAAVTRLHLSGSARARVTEQVVLGRHGEPGGTWSGRLVVERDGMPVLRTTQRSDVLAAGGVRAIVTHYSSDDPAGVDGGPSAPATHGGAVHCRLAAGGVLVTAIGPGLTSALADAQELSRARCGSTT